jgi:RecB family exonuclease
MWTYVKPEGKWYLKSKSYYSFGSTLHRVLERFHDSGDAGVETVGQALAAYEESWIDAGYSSAEEMAEAFGEGREIIQRYMAEHHAKPSEAHTLYTERQLRYDMGDFVLMGRIDRIDEYEDGLLEVVDYKSGRKEVTDEEVASDLAMGIYQLLVHKAFPGREVRATIIALRTGKQGFARLGEAEIAELERDLHRLGNEILHREYEFLTPTKKSLCTGCDFVPLCSKHPDYDGANT